MDFIVAAAHIRAFNYGLKFDLNRDLVRAKLADIIVPEFVPKSGVKISANEAEEASGANGADAGTALLVFFFFVCLLSLFFLCREKRAC